MPGKFTIHQERMLVGLLPPVLFSLNSMGATPTRMRLSFNFVNVYTIAYRVQYTFARVHARSLKDPREEKRACWSSQRPANKPARIIVRVRLVES